MNDEKYRYHAKRYLGDFELTNRLPREEDDFATRAEAEDWLREASGGTVEEYTKSGFILIAAVTREEAGGGAAFVA